MPIFGHASHGGQQGKNNPAENSVSPLKHFERCRSTSSVLSFFFFEQSVCFFFVYVNWIDFQWPPYLECTTPAGSEST